MLSWLDIEVGSTMNIGCLELDDLPLKSGPLTTVLEISVISPKTSWALANADNGSVP